MPSARAQAHILGQRDFFFYSNFFVSRGRNHSLDCSEWLNFYRKTRLTCIFFKIVNIACIFEYTHRPNQRIAYFLTIGTHTDFINLSCDSFHFFLIFWFLIGYCQSPIDCDSALFPSHVMVFILVKKPDFKRLQIAKVRRIFRGNARLIRGRYWQPLATCGEGL